MESVLWDINPFDQWGVELGKKICASLLPLGESKPPPAELAIRWQPGFPAQSPRCSQLL